MLKSFLPQLLVESVYDIDLEQLKAQGICGIITDLDNTLVGAGEPVAPPELAQWLDGVQQSGFKVFIISNNNQARVSKFAEAVSLPYIYRARKPLHRAFQAALRKLGLDASQCAMIGDQLLTDVLGGNRVGLHTILVQPIALQDEGLGTRINRKIERIIASRLEGKGWITWKN